MTMPLTSEIPFMSRDAEMGRILAGLRDSAPAAFVLAGPSGVGKTRLASEVSKQAGGLGFATAHVVASRAAGSIPLGPFAPFIAEAARYPGDLLGLLRQASDEVLRRAGPDRKLLLVVDDAQFLDDSSAALVHQLVHERACSVVASLRTPAPAPDAVTTLWKDGLAERIDLRAWSEPETQAVLGSVLGGLIARGAVRRLWEMSRGNALYLRELLIGAVTSGALTESGGIWSLHGPLAAPSRLVELVASRLSGLAPETVAVLELLAAGEPLGMPILERLADPAGLEDAEAQGFVHVGYDGRRSEVRISHPVYSEALRQSMPRSRMRRILATLAEILEETGAHRREDPLRLARWRLDSGTPGTPAQLDRAARRAMQMFDVELAARLARAALDAGAGADAGLVLGEAAFRSGRHQDAENLLASLVPLCRSDRERSQIASARAHNFHNLLGDPAAANAVIDEALTVITDPGSRLELLGRLAMMRVFEPDPSGTLTAARPLLDSADDALVSRGCYTTSIALALLGRSEEAVSVAYEGFQRHRLAMERPAGGLHHGPESQLIGAVLGHLAGGRLAAAEEDAAAGYQAGLAAGDKEGQATYLFLTGWVLIERGQLARAVMTFLDGASINRALHDIYALRWCLAGIALAEAMRAKAELAAEAAAERDGFPVGPMTVFEPDLVGRGKAWLCLASGETSRAIEILRQASAAAAAAELRVAEARLLHDIARHGQPAQVTSRLAALAEITDGGYVIALARHACALADGSPRDIEACGLAFDELGATLLAAEAYGSAATAYRSQGYQRAATAAARRAGELRSACGDVRSPALLFGANTPRLTRREREVAALAATGAPSREIAAKLVLSVRTVDNHLQKAYAKLGVTSREELARLKSW